MPSKNFFLLVAIVLIANIFLSYNFAAWMVHHKYNDASTINQQIEDVMAKVEDNRAAHYQLSKINEEVRFINTYCFG